MQTTREATGLDSLQAYQWFFLLAALYDGVLGITFFFLYRPIFAGFGIELPNNTSYIHLTAGVVAVQGLSFYFVWRDLMRNVDIVKAGIVYKAIYIAVVTFYLTRGELIHPMFAVFGALDVLFLIGFVTFLRAAQSAGKRQSALPPLPTKG